MVALGGLVEFKGGGTPSKAIDAYWGGDIPWASVKDFKSTELSETVDSITIEGLKNSASNLIPAGNLIVPTRMALGKVAINTVDIAINQDLRALIIKDEKALDKRYLLRFLESKAKFLESEGKGATVKGITQDVLRNLDVPLFPLSEQKRIAAILDKADSLRRKNQQAIQLADKFLRTVFLDMFGDPVTNPKSWKKHSLEDVCIEVIDCPHSTPKWSDKGTICLRTSNLTKGDWNWDDKRFVSEETYKERTKRAELKANDIILSREGTVGIAALVPENEKMCLGQRLVQLRVNTDILCPEYMLFLLLYELEPERISKVMAGSTSKHLNVKDLRNLAVAIPPLGKQQAFSKVFLKIKNKEKQNSLSDHYGNELFNALSQKAFASEL
jgi:type I restriction enzyme S subunit